MTEKGKQIESLLEKLRKQQGRAHEAQEEPPALPAWCEGDAVVAEFVRSFLLWEASPARAISGMESIGSSMVDLNELRVSLTEEVVAAIGKTYPRCFERAVRLKAALNDIYRREHTVRLSHLLEKSKRDARAYLESLAETPNFVASRTFLVALGGHAVPVDERLLSKLIEADVVDNETATPESTAASLEKVIRAGESPEAHLLFQGWNDECGKPVKAPRKAKPRGSGVAPVSSGAKHSSGRRPKSRD